MFEVKPRGVEKKGGSTETDDTSSSSKQCGGGGSMGSQGSESLYLYDSQDWVISPICSPEEEPCPTAISPMLAEETFRYMTYLSLDPSSYSHPGSRVLSADRVEQMTKTYNDIEVVTHLLAERDRDLELAARIGQSLLQRNHLLQERNESVEEQLAQALDQVHQLQHELGKKDELLRMVASASEESETDSSCSTPLHPRQPLAPAVALSQLEALQGKMSDLEEENLALRSEARHLKTETITFEEKEQQLVSDCVKELRESNSQMVNLTEELSHKNEEVMRHQEEISQLLSQIVELQHRVKELALEKEELRIHLQASKDAQRSLTAELNELADRNVECVGMLHESQEEIKELRSKNTPSAGMRRHLPYGLFPMDSLAAEIEGTFRKGLDVPAPSEYKNHPWRVFETVKVVNQASRLRSRCHSPGQVPGSSPVSLRSSRASTPRTSYYGSDSASLTLEDKPPSAVSRLAEVANTEDSSVSGPKRLGMPGMPGGQDLEAALRCLSDRQQSHASERPFFEVERERKLRALAAACQRGSEKGEGVGELGSSGFLTPNDSLVSSSVASTGTNYSNGSSQHSSAGSGGSRSYLPDRLQIVKPLEGSVTLHHWQQLAKPNLGGILHPRPGVLTKDFRELEIDLQHVYSLNDLEEDEPDLLQLSHGLAAGAHGTMVTPPSSGPNLPQTLPTHTVTTCRRHHPSLLLPSFSTSLCSRSLSARGSCEHLSPTSPSSSNQQHCVLTLDPSQAGGHHSTSTPAPPLSLGLLKLLEEQGISASTLPYPYHQLTPHTPHTRPTTAEEERGGGTCIMEEEGRMNIFSFNLVEKLRSLGLHKVAARGVVD